MEGEQPAAAPISLLLKSVERRVPFDRLAYVPHGAHDERVQPAADDAFPARHGCDVSLHRRIAVAFGDLRVAAGKKFHRLGRFRAALGFRTGLRWSMSH